MYRWWQILYIFVTASLCICFTPASPGMAQGTSVQWTPAQTIPGYGDETNPPILIADRNNTVHAFASQVVDEEDGLVAIIYNQWTPEEGWTTPIDILLSPVKKQARLLDALLDSEGFFHVVFFGGDETESYLYYSKALAVQAADARSWTSPEPIEESMIPPSGAIFEVADGRLIILHGTQTNGIGVYMSVSSDKGKNWSESIPVGMTNSNKLFPYNILTDQSSDGVTHAVWQVMNISGQGRGIFYSRYEQPEGKWSNPVDLSLGDAMTELGTMTPALKYHDNGLLVLYNISGKIVMKRSNDGGRSWNTPQPLFPNHIGVNGTLSLVEDSANGLHLLFGQRIPGSPDIHGLWHSQMFGMNWSSPAPLISGPQVVDMTGDTGFDPYDASAVIVQGNILLATWRTDPGMKGNGVWYAYRYVDAPTLPVEPLPDEAVLPDSTNSIVIPTATSDDNLFEEAIPDWTPASIDDSVVALEVKAQGGSPAAPILVGILPVSALVVILVIRLIRISR